MTPVWVAGFGPTPPASFVGELVWIAGFGSIVAGSATRVRIAGWGRPSTLGATAIWVAGFGPNVIGSATPVWVSSSSGSDSSAWNEEDAATNGMTLTNNNLTVTPSGAGTWQTIRCSVGKASGKLYIEFYVSAPASPAVVFGFGSSGMNIESFLGNTAYSVGLAVNGGGTFVSEGFTGNYDLPLFTPAMGDVVGLAIDFSAGSLWVARNNIWTDSSNPVTGSLPIASFVPATVGTLYGGLSFQGLGAGVWTLQASIDSQTYAAPTGFMPWDGPIVEVLPEGRRMI